MQRRNRLSLTQALGVNNQPLRLQFSGLNNQPSNQDALMELFVLNNQPATPSTPSSTSSTSSSSSASNSSGISTTSSTAATPTTPILNPTFEENDAEEGLPSTPRGQGVVRRVPQAPLRPRLTEEERALRLERLKDIRNRRCELLGLGRYLNPNCRINSFNNNFHDDDHNQPPRTAVRCC